MDLIQETEAFPHLEVLIFKDIRVDFNMWDPLMKIISKLKNLRGMVPTYTYTANILYPISYLSNSILSYVGFFRLILLLLFSFQVLRLPGLPFAGFLNEPISYEIFSSQLEVLEAFNIDLPRSLIATYLERCSKTLKSVSIFGVMCERVVVVPVYLSHIIIPDQSDLSI